MLEWINTEKVKSAFRDFQANQPFPHCIIDDFFRSDIAEQLSSEFPQESDNDVWHQYNNQIEVKKTCNNWNRFPQLTYAVFSFLNSQEFLDYLGQHSGISPLYHDSGLNGGGWHLHGQGGRLNPHLDYSIHPKLGLQRKINLLVYLNKDWQAEWGGQLGLWDQDPTLKKPGELQKEIVPLFNRAVFFDTTKNSWHGLTRPIQNDQGQCRRSLAIYYLTIPEEGAERRGKALFAPTREQEGDQDIIDLINLRSNVSTATSVYRK